MAEARAFDAVIVGAGFSGLYALHRLRNLGLTVRLFEAAPSVGGTWYWNRYPGARVDIESVEYNYTFSPELDAEWRWSERYATQPELLAYLNFVADRFDLRGDIQLDTRVAAAKFDEAANRWTIATDQGERVTARFCIMATGPLSAPNAIPFEGADSFEGESYRTADWPVGGVDFSGKRVGVIGTGSSAIQSIPVIAEQAAHLTVFQRTPNFSAPAHNGPVPPHVTDDWAVNRERYRDEARQMGAGVRLIAPSAILSTEHDEDERKAELEARWKTGGFAILGAYGDMMFDETANAVAADFVRSKIAEIVTDPETAKKLMPRGLHIGTKRMCVDTGYYATFNRPHVDLVDLRDEPIVRVEPTGLRTAKHLYELDALVYAIGFDAMTGALSRIDIEGRGGSKLKDVWADGPRTQLGLMVAGFPNLFIVVGPGSPSVLVNMVLAIEQQIDWISDCLAWLGGHGHAVIEATQAAQDAWVEHVNAVADTTLFPRTASWYTGANVEGKPRVFMPYIGGLPGYRELCDQAAASGYAGFAVS